MIFTLISGYLSAGDPFLTGGLNGVSCKQPQVGECITR